MNNELIARYVYAVTKRLPHKMRGDIEAELKLLISDMLEQRCGDIIPTEHDIRVVLTELGTPAELADKYDPDKHAALIGPPYYGKYKTVMKIVLLAVGGGMLLSGLMNLIFNGEGHLFFRLMAWIGEVFAAEMFAFAFVTALFAFFQRKGVKLDQDDALGDLPPVPKKHERIERSDPIAGIVFSVLFLVLFLWASPQIIGYFGDAGFVPLFNQSAIQKLWPLIVGIFALGIIKESFKLYEGRHTKRLAVVTLFTGVLNVLLIALFITADGLINPVFTTSLLAQFSIEDAFIVGMLSKFPLFLLGIVGFATVLDIVMAFVKSIKFGQNT